MNPDSQTPIIDLIAYAKSSDLACAGSAARELLSRHEECHEQIPAIINQMQHPNAAIADYAFLTLKRLGNRSVPQLLDRYQESNDSFKITLMGLIAGVAEFNDYFPLLRDEFKNGSRRCQIWAANCIGRKFDRQSNWPSDAIDILRETIKFLISLRGDAEHWPQARMTLRGLGELPDSAA